MAYRLCRCRKREKTMSRERKLLQRALDALEMPSTSVYREGSELIADIRAELEKPEPVECGWVAIVNGVLTNCWNNPDLPEGTHKLLAVRTDDDQKI
jgi:hypothetical protein